MDCSTLVDVSGLLDEVNAYRQVAGVPPLLLSETLQNAAAWKAQDMYENFYCDYGDSQGRGPEQLAWDFGYSPGIAITALIACQGWYAQDVVDVWAHNVEWAWILRDPRYLVCGVGMSLPYGISGDREWVLFLGPADDCPGPPCYVGCSCGYTGRFLDYCDCPEGTYPCPPGCDCHCPSRCTCPPEGPCYCRNYQGVCPPECFCTPGNECPPGCKTLVNGQCDCSGAQTGLGVLIVGAGLAAIGLSIALTMGRKKR